VTNVYRPGDYYVICDECGFKMRASEVRRRWDGLTVCTKDWESRHPQDFVQGRRDRQRVPNARPEPADTYLDIGDVTEADL